MMSRWFRPRVAAPQVQEPATLPDPDDESIERARRREIAAQRTRRGRASTILSQRPGATGMEFTRTLLG